MDANKFFGPASKVPIVGEFIIGCAIYFVLSVASATTNGFGLPESYRLHLQYAFLTIAIIYAIISLSYRLWKFLRKNRS